MAGEAVRQTTMPPPIDLARIVTPRFALPTFEMPLVTSAALGEAAIEAMRAAMTHGIPNASPVKGKPSKRK